MTSSPTFVEPGVGDGDVGASADDDSVGVTGPPHVLDIDAEPRWHADSTDLPKQPAVNRAIAAGVSYGLDEEQAVAFAYAVTDPQALRVGYANPTRIAGLGGYFEVLDVEVFVPAVVPMPTNHRVLEYLLFPAGGAEGYPPPTSPSSPAGEASELVLTVRDPSHLLDAADRAAEEILRHNAKMLGSIRALGIAMPLTLVGLAVEHADGTPTLHLVAAADGSSRLTNTQKTLLGLQTQRTHYDYSLDRRELRRDLGRLIGTEDDGEREAIHRALTAPARLILKFVPSVARPATMARAVAAHVGLMHVEAPTPWSEASKSEAKAEVVLETLLEHGAFDEEEITYLAARLSPDEAEARGYPAGVDEQAASVLAALLSPRVARLVRQGIRAVTGQSRVEVGGYVDTVADLAMRGLRGLPESRNDPRKLKLVRARYTRASRMEEYRTKPWKVTGRPVDEIFGGAVAELSMDPDTATWTNRLELAALGQFHLTREGILTREKYGAKAANRDDMRASDALLSGLLATKWGLTILRQAIIDGRAGRPLRQVDEDKNVGPVVMSDQWLRETVLPRAGDPKEHVEVPDEAMSPPARFAALRLRFTSTVRLLREVQDEVAGVSEEGTPLVEQHGWPAEDCRPLIEALREIEARLTVWEARSAEVAKRLSSRDLGERVTDDDEDDEFDEQID